MLELRNVDTYYGNIQALRDISLKIEEGEIVTLIGANGAGKSTTLMTICGINRPRSGEILWYGKPIHQLPSHEIVTLGISQVPEGRLIFPDLSVSENLDLGAFLRRDPAGVKDDLDYVFSLFPILSERRKQAGGTLSGGEQQMLAISRALMARPKLLLLDEPAAGMNPTETAELLACINIIRDRFGIAILLIEHDMSLVMNVCQRIQVINFGQTIAAGLPEEIAVNPEVIKAYLGS